MKRSINLLPKKRPEEERAKRRRRMLLIVTLVASVLIFFLAWFIPSLLLRDVKRQEEDILSQISEKEKGIAALWENEVLYRTVINKAKAARLVFELQQTLGRDVDRLRPLLNTGVSMQSLEIGRGNTKLAVTTSRAESFFAYLTALEGTGTRDFFTQLTISALTLDAIGGYSVGIEGGLIP